MGPPIATRITLFIAILIWPAVASWYSIEANRQNNLTERGIVVHADILGARASFWNYQRTKPSHVLRVGYLAPNGPWKTNEVSVTGYEFAHTKSKIQIYVDPSDPDNVAASLETYPWWLTVGVWTLALSFSTCTGFIAYFATRRTHSTAKRAKKEDGTIFRKWRALMARRSPDK